MPRWRGRAPLPPGAPGTQGSGSPQPPQEPCGTSGLGAGTTSRSSRSQLLRLRHCLEAGNYQQVRACAVWYGCDGGGSCGLRFCLLGGFRCCVGEMSVCVVFKSFRLLLLFLSFSSPPFPSHPCGSCSLNLNRGAAVPICGLKVTWPFRSAPGSVVLFCRLCLPCVLSALTAGQSVRTPSRASACACAQTPMRAHAEAPVQATEHVSSRLLNDRAQV